MAGGSAFVTRFAGLHWDESTSVGVPYPFELYANGGPWLVVIGLGIIGYIGGRMELKLVLRQKGLGAFWALALATATLSEGGERMEVVGPALVAAALSAFVLGVIVEQWRGEVAAPFREARLRSAGLPRARLRFFTGDRLLPGVALTAPAEPSAASAHQMTDEGRARR